MKKYRISTKHGKYYAEVRKFFIWNTILPYIFQLYPFRDRSMGLDRFEDARDLIEKYKNLKKVPSRVVWHD